VEPDLLGHLAGGGEQVHQQLAEMVGPDAVEIVLPLAPGLDQPGDAEQGQVMADRRLALAEPLAEVGHVELAVLGQVEEDPQSGLVAQELEHLRQLADRLFGDLGHGRLDGVPVVLAGTLH